MTVIASPASSAIKPAVRVMVVDDSAVIRGVITRWIEAVAELKVVATAFNGQAALGMIASANPDVIILDIEMPVMDGITALPLLLKAAPGVKIIMASTLTRRNAEISLRALSLGAADYLAKPTALVGGQSEEFRHDLMAKLLALGGVNEAALRLNTPAFSSGKREVVLRKPSVGQPQILVIGASTGGPQALGEVICGIAPGLNIPVLITQHMPATFTAILAEHLSRMSGLSCREGVPGANLLPGHVLIAPGDFHMSITGRNGTVQLSQTAPENFCRPSVDPLFRSAAAAYGANVLAVMLTGMGSDGRDGARAIAENGGTVLVQDEATSVVWGMPAAVAHAGLASSVLPLKSIAPEIRKYLGMRSA